MEMMSGAIWVRDRLAAACWEVKVAHERKVCDVAPLACNTDQVDARVVAKLCRRDLVPELWVAPLEDRGWRERLRRRTHLVRMRASAMNRIFGLLTQWGLRLSLKRLRAPDAMGLLEQRGVLEVWRRSIVEALAVIDLLDERITPIDQELGPLARADARVVLLDTIPGVGELLGLTIASEIGDVARLGSPRKLIGYAGLAPKINQSGERCRTGRYRRRAHARCAGPPSRPPTMPGGPPIPGTRSTATSRHAPARTRQVRGRGRAHVTRRRRRVDRPRDQARGHHRRVEQVSRKLERIRHGPGAMAGCRAFSPPRPSSPGPASTRPRPATSLRLAVATGEAVSARALRTLDPSARG